MAAFKELLWVGWVPFLAANAVWNWHTGALPGYWTFMICLLAMAYVCKTMMHVELRRNR